MRQASLQDAANCLKTLLQHVQGILNVPVPCTAMRLTHPGSISPVASAFATSLLWEGPLGAVRLLERPSWFTALPCNTAIGCNAVCASRSGAITNTTKPSPRP